jgi:hypothetical protein
MPSANSPLLAFSAGEVDRQALVRVDLEEGPVRTGEVMENMALTVRGAMSKAPGSRYIDSTPSDDPARLWPFVFSATQAMALEISASGIRFISGNSIVQLGGGDGAIGGAGDASSATVGDPGDDIGSGGGETGGGGGFGIRPGDIMWSGSLP